MTDLRFDVELTSSDLLKKVEQIRTGIRSIVLEMEEQGRKADSSFFKKVFNALDGTKMLKEFVAKVIETRKEMEQLDKAFEALLGSKEKAETFGNAIKDYALNSPLLVSDISQAAQALLAYNVSAEEIMPTLERLGDISLGDSQRFSSLALAFGQISAEGKMTSEHLTLLINAGFNPLQTIAEKTGVSISQLTDDMKNGKISVEMVADAFGWATEEGGKFHGMMERGAEGIIGSQNRLRGAIQDTLNKIGEQNEELIEGAYDTVTFLVKNYENIGRVIISLIATYGAARAALLVYDIIKAKDIALDYAKLAITGKLDAATKALNLTMLKNPYVLAAALIVGVAMAMWTMMDRTTAAEKAQERYNKRVQEANEKEQERKNALQGLISELEDMMTAEARRVEIFDIIKENYPTFFKYMLDEQGHITDLTQAWKAYNEEMLKNKLERSKQRAAELKTTIAEEKRFLELYDMGYKRTKVIQNSESDKKIWAKYGARGTYNIKKDININSLELLQVEKDILKDSFNQWRANLKQKSNEQLKAMIIRLKSRRKAFAGNEDALNKYIQALEGEQEFRKAQVNPTKNKKYWEGELRKAEDNLAALSDIDALGEKGKEIKKRIEEYRKKLEAFSINSRLEKAPVLTEVNSIPLISVLEGQEREQIRSIENMWNDIWQAQIDTMNEGSKKTLEQMELNHEKKLQAIDREKEDVLQKKKEEAEIEFNKREDRKVAKDPNYKRASFDTSLITLSEEENKYFDEKYSVALAQQSSDVNNYYKTILEKYKDFSLQRISVEKHYDDDIAILRAKRTNDNAKEIDLLIEQAQRKKKEAIQQIDDAEAREMVGNNDFLKNLYGDYSQMKFEDLRNLLKEAKLLQDYLAGNGSIDGLKFITKEQLAIIEKSSPELANLKGALDKLLQSGKTNPWEKVFDSFSEGLSKLRESKDISDISEAMKDIGGAAAEASAMLSGVAGNLSKMFEDMGNTDAAEALSSVQGALDAISNIGEGFSKGGIIGGIGAAVGEAANFIGKAFAANARHKEALKQIMNEATAQQQAYNLLLLEQNLLYERGTTILGVDGYGKAKNAVNVMKNAMADLNKELRGDGEYDGGRITKYMRNVLKSIGKYEGSSLELKDQYEGLAQG